MKICLLMMVSFFIFGITAGCSKSEEQPVSSLSVTLLPAQKAAFDELNEFFIHPDLEERAAAYDRIAFVGDMDVYPLSGFLGYLKRDIVSEDEGLRGSVVNAAGYYLSDSTLYPALEVLFKTHFAIEKNSILEDIFNQDWSAEIETLIFPMLWDEDEDVRDMALNLVSYNDAELDTPEKAKAHYQDRYNALKK